MTGAWGVYSLALLFFMPKARTVGLATLFATAGKLVVFDLSQVEPFWRILYVLELRRRVPRARLLLPERVEPGEGRLPTK